MRKLRVAIDVRIPGDGSTGSMQQVLIGMVSGAAALKEKDIEYVYISHTSAPQWLARYLGANQKLHVLPPHPLTVRQRIRGALGPIAPLAGKIDAALFKRVKKPVDLLPASFPETDGVAESLGVDLLHLAYPDQYYRSTIPTVSTIYDVQHIHLPQYFGKKVLEWREVVYPAMFQHSEAVFTISETTRKDLVSHYGLPPHKIETVFLGPVNQFYPEVNPVGLAELRRKFSLPEKFVLFPAMLYQHKNHLLLLEALAQLRDKEGLEVFLFAPGKKYHYGPAIEEKVASLKLEGQVCFPGFVSEQELRSAYRGAVALVFPSQFEGAGMPIMEAMYDGLSVACSDIGAHKEYGGSATLSFDPLNVSAMAEAIKRIWTQPHLRQSLIAKGKKQVSQFSWEKVAASYSDVYRRVARDGQSRKSRRS